MPLLPVGEEAKRLRHNIANRKFYHKKKKDKQTAEERRAKDRQRKRQNKQQQQQQQDVNNRTPGNQPTPMATSVSSRSRPFLSPVDRDQPTPPAFLMSPQNKWLLEEHQAMLARKSDKRKRDTDEVNDLRERQAEELKEIRERQAEDLKEIRERQAEDLKEMLPLSKTNLKWSSQSSFLLWPLSEAVTCWFLAAGRALSSK
jgi:DNA repair exonuclease SbcCD ATPase subunit